MLSDPGCPELKGWTSLTDLSLCYVPSKAGYSVTAKACQPYRPEPVLHSFEVFSNRSEPDRSEPASRPVAQHDRPNLDFCVDISIQNLL